MRVRNVKDLAFLKFNVARRPFRSLSLSLSLFLVWIWSSRGRRDRKEGEKKFEAHKRSCDARRATTGARE